MLLSTLPKRAFHSPVIVRLANVYLDGQNIIIQPVRDKSLFWHCERPRSGAVVECMRRSRAAYHYAVRRVEKDKEVIVGYMNA
jgi:hypothetical protein